MDPMVSYLTWLTFVFPVVNGLQEKNKDIHYAWVLKHAFNDKL